MVERTEARIPNYIKFFVHINECEEALIWLANQSPAKRGSINSWNAIFYRAKTSRWQHAQHNHWYWRSFCHVSA